MAIYYRIEGDCPECGGFYCDVTTETEAYCPSCIVDGEQVQMGEIVEVNEI